MSIFIAFLGGMLTLLSPCTLPVIPLLFASVRGRRGQLAIMLAGMALITTPAHASAAGSDRCWPGWR